MDGDEGVLLVCGLLGERFQDVEGEVPVVVRLACADQVRDSPVVGFDVRLSPRESEGKVRDK